MIQVDRHTIIQVLGSLMQKPLLLSDVDKYSLLPSDFSTQLDKFIFSAIYNLYMGGAASIHVTDVENYLNQNSMAKEILEKNNGLQFLQDCEVHAEVENFNYYYGKLKKINLLRDLEKSGRSIDKFYCDNPLDSNYDKIMKKFETLTAADIVNQLKGEIAHYESKYAITNLVEESNACDGIRQLISTLKTEPEVGVKLQGDIFNTVCRGGRKGKLYLRSAGSGYGKALPNFTKIPTPNGWFTVGEIKEGDYLFDREGKPTKVLKVYPQKQKKEIYKVYFKSGRIAECCDEHLWSYYSNKNDKAPDKLITKTLREIINEPKGLRDNKGCYRWSIPICKPVQYPKKEYSIDPYVMGLILGDGSFRYTKSQKGFFYSSSDEELVKAIQERMGYYKYKKVSNYNYSWVFELNDKKDLHKNVWVEDILKQYPELWQLKSQNKFIPRDFLFGSVEQRYDLLAGLLDTDGTIDKKGRIDFFTSSPLLKNDIIELCESLGMIATVSFDKRSEKYTTDVVYIVHIQAKKEEKIKMFKLNRKLNRAKKYLNNNKRNERKDRDSIIKIEATGIFTEMTCFYVDNEEHLFLMNNFICTHNTRSAVADACQIAYPIRYEPKYGRWVATGTTEKVLYTMTEQDPAEIQTMILAYLTGYNEEIFLYGQYGEEHMDRINKAIKIMEDYKDNMLFARIPDPCASVVKNLFRRYNLQYGVENFFYDYIFSSPAMLDEYRDLQLPEHVCLRLFTTALKNLAVELNAFIMTSTQISNDEKDGGFRDFRNIRGARAIVDLVDLACIRRRPTPEELQLVSGFEKSYNLTPNAITDIFKNRRGRWNMISIWQTVDLGTLRTYDLFATTSDNKPITDFQIVDFVSEIPKELTDLEDEFNKNLGDRYVADIENKDCTQSLMRRIENEQEEVPLRSSLYSAFGDEKDEHERYGKMEWGDLI